jgi:predicted phage terminase large subunit-like protein
MNLENLGPAELIALGSALPGMPPEQQKEVQSVLTKMIPEMAKKHYWFYVQYTNKGLWFPGKVHMYLCNEVQEFIETNTGHPYDILLIHMPPQFGKSTTITEALPSWMMCKDPNSKGMLISYTDDVALRFTKANKDKVNEFGAKLFGASFDPELNRADEYRLLGSNGYAISRGIGGSITSYTADWMVIDDPVKSSAQADSELNRQRANLEWNMTLRTRLKPGSKVIVIMTRWHELDLGGYIQTIEDPACVRVINLPCEAEENDPLGREIGEALAPEIGRDNKWLEWFKKGFLTDEGTRAWTAMYQCRPTSVEGNVLKREWWQRYDVAPEMVQTLMSVDAAFKDGAKNDYVSIQVWGKRGADAYCLDNDTRHMSFSETLRAIRNMRARHPKCWQILVEDKANGSAIIDMLRHEITGIIPVTPQGSKTARVNAVEHAIEAHQVYLPKNQPWVAGFIEECAAFPTGKHDDQVDAMSQALMRLLFMGKYVPPAQQPKAQFPFEHQERTEGAWMEW